MHQKTSQTLKLKQNEYGMHIESTGVELKRDLPCGSRCADISIPAVSRGERAKHHADFQSFRSQWRVYLFIYFRPFTSVMIERLMCLLQMYFAVETVRERKKRHDLIY